MVMLLTVHRHHLPRVVNEANLVFVELCKVAQGLITAFT